MHTYIINGETYRAATLKTAMARAAGFRPQFCRVIDAHDRAQRQQPRVEEIEVSRYPKRLCIFEERGTSASHSNDWQILEVSRER